MKKLIFTLLIACCSFFNVSAQGLKNIIVEKYYISDANDAAASAGNLPAGSVTYRIFADMLNGYKFQGVYGIPDPVHELRFSTTTSFFNNEDRGASYANDIKNTYLKNNTVMLDSWLSVGAGSGANLGVLKGEDTNGAIVNGDGILQNTDVSAGIPIKTKDGLLPGTPKPVTTVGLDNIIGVFGDGSANGNLFSTTNGSWACLDGAVGPASNNRVLIAQITTDGIFTFELNIQIGTASGAVERYVAKNPVDKEMQRDFLTYSSETSNMKPIVKISSPSDSSNYNTGDVVNIAANAFDPDGSVSNVEFFVDGISIGSVTTEPYSINYTGTLGNHSLTAVAKDNKAAKDTSEVVTIIVGTTGINQSAINNDQLAVYPNPAHNLITIQCSKDGVKNSRLNIFNIMGRSIFFEDFKSNVSADKIDISSFANGLYIIEINQDGIKSYKKFIKN